MAAVEIQTHPSTDAMAEVLGAIFDIVQDFSMVYAIPVAKVTSVCGLPALKDSGDEIVYITTSVGTNLCFAP